MKKMIIDNEIFQNIPSLSIGIVIVRDIDNSKTIDLKEEFSTISEKIIQKFAEVELSEYPVIRNWRNVYKSFGEKKNRSSIEALIRRIINGKELPSINPLVDIYNLISLRYEMPCGGEDLSTIDSDIELSYSNGDEIFFPLGSEEKETPNQGEIIYKFGNHVICRSFNYRESDLTKLTEKTSSAILVIENLNADRNTLNSALSELSIMVNDNLGGSSEIVILDETNNETEIG